MASDPPLAAWPYSAPVLDRLTARARAGLLDAAEQAMMADRLAEYRDHARRLEDAIHRITKH